MQFRGLLTDADSYVKIRCRPTADFATSFWPGIDEVHVVTTKIATTEVQSLPKPPEGSEN